MSRSDWRRRTPVRPRSASPAPDGRLGRAPPEELRPAPAPLPPRALRPDGAEVGRRSFGIGINPTGRTPRFQRGIVHRRRNDPAATWAKTPIPLPEGRGIDFEIRRRPTLPGGLPPSTIGAGSLNFRVRDGNGCDPAAIATEIFCCQGCAPIWGSPPRTPEQTRAIVNPSPRPISTGRLHTLPCLHLRPINVVVLPRALLR